MYICKHCSRTEFKSKKSYLAHESKCKHNPDKVYYNTSSPERNAKIALTNIRKAKQKYSENPSKCKLCDNAIDYNNRNQLFCSPQCKSSSIKLSRPKHSTETKKRISKTLSSKKKYSWRKDLSHQYRNTDKIFTKIFKNTCAHCGKVSYTKRRKKYCKEHEHLYGANGRNKFVFTFNVYSYPGLFDLELISKYKWRCSKTNPNGITRDHKISINEAIRNDYDPYYIKHPLNCELMLFNDNNKKNTHSSIEYTDLISQVIKYEKVLSGST